MCRWLFQCKCGSCYIPQRYIMCVMSFIGILISYASRCCMNIAITAMVPSLAKNNETEVINTTMELCEDNRPPSESIKDGEYEWTEIEQGILLAGFFWGYAVGHIPAGYLADLLGGKNVFSFGVLTTGVGSMLTPLSIQLFPTNVWPATIIRFIMGVMSASLFPATSALTGAWAPKTERSRMSAIITSGAQVGTLVGNYATSLLIQLSGTWTFAYYFWGFSTVVWYLFYQIMVSSDPRKHPYITEDEAAYLEKELVVSQKMDVPWCKILLSCPIWALMIVSIGHDITFGFLSAVYPKYLNDVLKCTLTEIGIHTSMPYVLQWITTQITAYICDYLIKSEILSIVTTRKIFTFIGTVMPGFFLLLIGYMGCNRTGAIICAYLSLLTMAPYYPGLRVNPVDLTRNFTGLVMALSNGAGICGFLPIPLIAGHIGVAPYAPEQYMLLYWLMFLAAFFTTFVFIIFGEAERQPWDFES